MRWNRYVFESQVRANRAARERLARRQAGTIEAQEQTYRRLRDNPHPPHIPPADARTGAMDEINDPRVSSRALEGAKVKIGGDAIRDIPFQYAPAAITTSFHQ